MLDAASTLSQHWLLVCQGAGLRFAAQLDGDQAESGVKLETRPSPVTGNPVLGASYPRTDGPGYYDWTGIGELAFTDGQLEGTIAHEVIGHQLLDLDESGAEVYAYLCGTA